MESNKGMLIVIMILLIVMLGAIAGASIVLLRTLGNQEASGTGASGGQVSAGRLLNQEDITKVELGDAIVTNLLPGSDTRAHNARIGVMLGFDNTLGKISTDFETLLNDNLGFARSIALACIRNSTYDDLTERGGSERLATNIRMRLQEEFNTNLIVDVYFIEWVVQ